MTPRAWAYALLFAGILWAAWESRACFEVSDPPKWGEP